jgi:hypothetical protein
MGSAGCKEVIADRGIVAANEILVLRFYSPEATMKRSAYLALSISLAVFLVLAATAPYASAQTRMSDKDVESLMKNLQQDATAFRSAFNSAVGKSTIRKTSQAKDAKSLVQSFQKQTENMLIQFKSSKKADQLPNVVATADQIDKLLTATPMGEQTNNAWAKVKSALSLLSQQFGVAA